MNKTPSPIIKSIDRKPSIADFYAIEIKFKAVERQYNAIMLQIDGTCLDTSNTNNSTDCIKAQELNLEMQAYLRMLADILIEIGPIGKEYQDEIVNQQSQVDHYVIKLQKQNAELVAALSVIQHSSNISDNSKIMLRQHKYEYIGWSLGSIILAILIYRQMMRKN